MPRLSFVHPLSHSTPSTIYIYASGFPLVEKIICLWVSRWLKSCVFYSPQDTRGMWRFSALSYSYYLHQLLSGNQRASCKKLSNRRWFYELRRATFRNFVYLTIPFGFQWWHDPQVKRQEQFSISPSPDFSRTHNSAADAVKNNICLFCNPIFFNEVGQAPRRSILHKFLFYFLFICNWLFSHRSLKTRRRFLNLWSFSYYSIVPSSWIYT